MGGKALISLVGLLTQGPPFCSRDVVGAHFLSQGTSGKLGWEEAQGSEVWREWCDSLPAFNQAVPMAWIP